MPALDELFAPVTDCKEDGLREASAGRKVTFMINDKVVPSEEQISLTNYVTTSQDAKDSLINEDIGGDLASNSYNEDANESQELFLDELEQIDDLY